MLPHLSDHCNKKPHPPHMFFDNGEMCLQRTFLMQNALTHLILSHVRSFIPVYYSWHNNLKITEQTVFTPSMFLYTAIQMKCCQLSGKLKNILKSRELHKIPKNVERTFSDIISINTQIMSHKYHFQFCKTFSSPAKWQMNSFSIFFPSNTFYSIQWIFFYCL